MELFYNILPVVIIIAFGIPLSVSDIRRKTLPLFLTVPSLTVSIVFTLMRPDTPEYLISGVTGFVFVIVIRIITRGGIGLGDSLVSAFLGFLLGFSLWLPAVLLGSLGALTVTLVRIKREEARIKSRIPFAPFLISGGFLVSGFKLLTIL